MSADSYQNDQNLEVAWAFKAYEHAEIHYSIITSVDATFLHLSEHDDEIYKTFRESFPEFDVNIIHVEDLKSDSSKKKWRTFCNKFDGFQNFNYGSLLRLDPMLDYSDENTTFATRIQFLAIEIARNREGLTRKLYQKTLQTRKTNIFNVDDKGVEKVTDSAKDIPVS
ncbi:protein PBDC1-like [Clavelina lepadiformis]|uniref:Polysaccharide biosynthesis domain-containing protein n=1 Tax=Clavelina lepadiformis TaxID=159417 RepID=A0ABP0FAW6_CLALP